MNEDKKNKQKKSKKTKKSSKGNYIFFGGVLILYLILYIFYPGKIIDSIKYSTGILKQVLPILLFIILFMWGLKYIPNNLLKKYIGKDSGVKGWIFAAMGGMLSHGPIFAWYPLLKEFREKGFSEGQVAVFLYNRAIKLPILPMMIYYFGLEYTIILSLVMILISLLQGFLINLVMR